MKTNILKRIAKKVKRANDKGLNTVLVFSDKKALLIYQQEVAAGTIRREIDYKMIEAGVEMYIYSVSMLHRILSNERKPEYQLLRDLLLHLNPKNVIIRLENRAGR